MKNKTIIATHPKNGQDVNIEFDEGLNIVSVTYKDGEDVDLTLDSLKNYFHCAIYNFYEFNEKKELVWADNDSDYDLIAEYGIKSPELKKHYDKVFLEFDYAYDLNGNSENFLSKQDIIDLIEESGAILLSYTACGEGGGNPCFNVLVENSEDKFYDLLLKIYQMDESDFSMTFGYKSKNDYFKDNPLMTLKDIYSKEINF